MTNKRFLAIIAALAAGAAIATWGKQDSRVGFSTILSLFTDTARDADQVALKATRLSDAEEMRIGVELAAPFISQEDAVLTNYVNDVGAAVAKGVRRRGVQYHFHVVNGAAANAFALPGGQIVVYSGLFGFVESEAELAAILGHEAAHVDLGHCVGHYQYEARLGMLAGIAHRMLTFTFDPFQEAEADIQGEQFSVEAGYDPDAAATLFERMKRAHNEPERRRAHTPAGEVVVSAADLLGDFLRSHPPSEVRAESLRQMVGRNHDRFAGRRFYVGRQNLAQRLARSRREYAGELRAF